MPRAKQVNLIKDPRKSTKLWWIAKQHVYGGSLNYRKVRRPFDSTKLTHAVFKGKLGKALWFTRREALVRKILLDVASRYGIRIRDVAVNHDHIHILFYTKSREAQIRFLRLVSAEVGRKYKAIKSELGVSAGSIWPERPFTRLISWGKKSLARVERYIERNRHEALGFIEYQPRKHALSKFLIAWSGQRELSSA